MTKYLLRWNLVWVLLFSSIGVIRPQSAIDNTKSNPAHRFLTTVVGDFWHVASSPFKLSKKDAVSVLSFAAFNAGLITFGDAEADEELALEGYHGVLKPAKWMAKVGEVYDNIGTQNVALGLSAGMFTGGIIFKNKKLRETTRLMLESLLIASTITYWSKRAIGRARPFANQGASEFDLFGSGNSNREYRSMPSGHATSAFSVMTVIAKQYSQWWVKYPAYFWATSVALQRMNDRQHWASDVLVGGAIGYWVGNLLVTHQARKRNPLKISAIYSINRIGMSVYF